MQAYQGVKSQVDLFISKGTRLAANRVVFAKRRCCGVGDDHVEPGSYPIAVMVTLIADLVISSGLYLQLFVVLERLSASNLSI